jgi:hypothetical protein
MPFNMTSINIDKEKFVAECIAKYKTSGEYDISLVFDDFFEEYYIDVSQTSENLLETDLLPLYDELYLMVEKVLIDEYESEAETDDEQS